MAKKVTIELRPYDALSILAFCREYFNNSNRDVPQLAAIHETIDNYETEIRNKITSDHLADDSLECTVNDITGRHPER